MLRRTVLEKVLEKRLIRTIELLNGWCLKWWPVSFTGLPDRIVLLPGARIRFVEVKRVGHIPSERQKWVHKKLRAFGFKVYTISTEEHLNQFISEL